MKKYTLLILLNLLALLTIGQSRIDLDRQAYGRIFPWGSTSAGRESLVTYYIGTRSPYYVALDNYGTTQTRGNIILGGKFIPLTGNTARFNHKIIRLNEVGATGSANGSGIQVYQDSIQQSSLLYDPTLPVPWAIDGEMVLAINPGTSGQFLSLSGSNLTWVDAPSGSSIDTSLFQIRDVDLTTIANLTVADNDILQRKSGAWVNRTLAQLKAEMTYSLNDVTVAGNTSNAGITVSGGNVMLTTIGSSGAISLRQSSPGPYNIDIYPVELDDNYTLRLPAVSDTLLVRGDIVPGLMPSEIGTAGQAVRVNSTGTGLEYYTREIPWKRTHQDQIMGEAFTDITDMSIPVAAYDSLYLQITLHVGTSANNGARYTITAPTGASLKAMLVGQTTTAIASGASGNATQWITSPGSSSGSLNGLAQANQNTVITGWVVNGSTAGTIQVQARSMSALNTVTIYAGSMLTYHK